MALPGQSALRRVLFAAHESRTARPHPQLRLWRQLLSQPFQVPGWQSLHVTRGFSLSRLSGRPVLLSLGSARRVSLFAFLPCTSLHGLSPPTGLRPTCEAPPPPYFLPCVPNSCMALAPQRTVLGKRCLSTWRGDTKGRRCSTCQSESSWDKALASDGHAQTCAPGRWM